MDLVETADHYVLRADLPGLSDEDVNVQLEDNVLTISGERKPGTNTMRRATTGRACVRRLRPVDSPCPTASTLTAVGAHFDRGVLQITIPKPEQKTSPGPDLAGRPPNRRPQQDREHHNRRPEREQQRPGPGAGLIHELPIQTLHNRGPRAITAAVRDLRSPSPISGRNAALDK